MHETQICQQRFSHTLRVEKIFMILERSDFSGRRTASNCAALLHQLEQEQSQGKPWFRGDLSSQNYIRLSGRDKHCGDTCRRRPTQAVATVSIAMGHNWLEIIFSHYNCTGWLSPDRMEMVCIW